MRNSTKGTKKLGALLSALIIGGVFLLLAAWMLISSLGIGGGVEVTVILAFCAVFYLIPVVGIAVALVQRWKEIKREEDEARKY